MKDKQLINIKSSDKVAKFLDTTKLHKKDFAEMIGVTLSYVYNLIDNSLPFSTRSITIERIATVMEVNPEEFEEYKIPQEPILIDYPIELIRSTMKEKRMSVVNFLKAFPRKKRLQIVDMLRGTLPIPIDYKELSMIGKVLEMDNSVLYNIWETRFKQVLETNGMNYNANAALINNMLDCAKKYAQIQ